MADNLKSPTLQQELDTDPFEVREQEVYMNLVRTHAMLSSQFADLFKECGLSEPLYNVLKVVSRAGEQGVPSQSIAPYMLARDPDITRLVDRLVKEGLVTRERSTEDRRVVRVIITKAGCQKVQELGEPVKRLHQTQLGHIHSRELQLLNELLVEARYPPSLE